MSVLEIDYEGKKQVRLNSGSSVTPGETLSLGCDAFFWIPMLPSTVSEKASSEGYFLLKEDEFEYSRYARRRRRSELE